MCSSVVSFLNFVFSRFDHMCFLFPSWAFSVHNLFFFREKKVCETSANLTKKFVNLFPFFLLGNFSQLFLHVCPSFDRFFPCLICSHLFLNILLFEFSFMNVFPLLLPFCLFLFFLKTLFGIVFFSFSTVTYSPCFTKSHVVFEWFPFVLSLFLEKHVFLVC